MLRLGLDAGGTTIESARELGISGVPVGAADLVREGPASVVARLRRDGLQVCQIGAYGYNPLHPDSDVLARETAVLREAIPLAAASGCRYIVICGGNYHPSGFLGDDPRNHRAEALDRVAEALAPLLDLAERHGALLSIEPYLKSAISDPSSFLGLMARVNSPALKVNIDVTSLYSYNDILDPALRIRAVCRELRGHYGLVHLKEVALRDGFHIHIDLSPIGDGPTDWGLVLAEAAPFVPPDSWLVIEHVQDADEARRSVGIVRAAAAAHGIALDGELA